ncbi:MAG: metal-sensitive transcriptional regulator [Chthonomonas sp.]|nr:metal-sensitive transcriptional regulator [Chthonomonas sp.]
MNDTERRTLDRRLARVEGQVRGLRRLVEEGAYCCDLLNQISAATSALNQVAAAVASNHIQHCIASHQDKDAHPTAKSMTQDELMDELEEVLSRLMR